jgi:hypothetical protein
MIGSKERVVGLLPPVTREALVPTDHVSRHRERTLDLGFVRDLVRDTYAAAGRPSIDPVVFFTRQLVLFFEGLRSDRSARPQSEAGAWGGISMRTTSTGCAATTRPNPTPRPCANGRSGSPLRGCPASPRPRTGTGYDDFGCGGWSRPPGALAPASSDAITAALLSPRSAGSMCVPPMSPF